MSNDMKVQTLASVVLKSSDFKRVHTRPEFVARFQAAIDRLQAERKFRNLLVHSQILFEFAEKGLGPPLLSARVRDRPEAKFDQTW